MLAFEKPRCLNISVVVPLLIKEPDYSTRLISVKVAWDMVSELSTRLMLVSVSTLPEMIEEVDCRANSPGTFVVNTCVDILFELAFYGLSERFFASYFSSNEI